MAELFTKGWSWSVVRNWLAADAAEAFGECPDATKMRPRTPGNEGQGGSTRVGSNPQLNPHSALQLATKVKEGQ